MKANYSPFFLILASLLGLLSGALPFGAIHTIAEGVSQLFLNLLKLLSLPIISLSLLSTITSMKDFQEIRNLGWKIFRYTLMTTFIAASIALILFLVLHPTEKIDTTQPEIPLVSPSQYFDSLLQIIPSNLFEAFRTNNVIGVAFISIFFSIAVLLLPSEQKKPLHQFFSYLFSALLKMVQIALFFMPIGIWAFMTLFMKELPSQGEHMKSLALYITCILSANLLQGGIVLPLLAKAKGISPLFLFRGMYKALTIAFFTKSSNAALPVSMECAEKNLQVDRKISSFSFPLCSVINMNACAAFILITTLFVATSHGLSFSPLELFGWIFLASIAAIGNAGVPMGCYFLTSAFLSGMNVPLYLMGVILPFYALLDMLETAINVWSDSCITTIVDRDLKKKSFRAVAQNPPLS